MKQFDQLPKTVKKTVRYILQDVELDKLEEIEGIILSSIHKRKEVLEKEADRVHKIS